MNEFTDRINYAVNKVLVTTSLAGAITLGALGAVHYISNDRSNHAYFPEIEMGCALIGLELVERTRRENELLYRRSQTKRDL